MVAFAFFVFALAACDNGREGPINNRYLTELSTQDFEMAYELGKAFVNDFYAQKAGRAKMDFSKYIVNENLLKYSNRRTAVETHVYDVKETFVGIEQVQFIPEDKCFYLSYTVYAKDSYTGGVSNLVEILMSTVDGRLVVADWYIACGAGISSFDESYRPNATIDSPYVWDNQEYVRSLFEKAGIE